MNEQLANMIKLGRAQKVVVSTGNAFDNTTAAHLGLVGAVFVPYVDSTITVIEIGDMEAAEVTLLKAMDQPAGIPLYGEITKLTVTGGGVVYCAGKKQA